jgi:hypothetical protein
VKGDLAALEAELEGALMDAMMGDPWGRGLQARLEREAKSVLMRHGVRGARVVVSQVRPGGVGVQVVLPPSPQRVQQVVLRFGAPDPFA